MSDYKVASAGGLGQVVPTDPEWAAKQEAAYAKEAIRLQEVRDAASARRVLPVLEESLEQKIIRLQAESRQQQEGR